MPIRVTRPFDASSGVGRKRTFTIAGGPEALLRTDAVWWIDALYSGDSQTVTNLGTGGTALNAQLGSVATADSNDPLFLAYEGTPYVYVPGATGNYLSVPDANALDITGDIDIRVRVAADDWTPAANQVLLGKYDTNQISYELTLTTSGTLSFVWSSNGTTSTSQASSAATGVTDGSVKWVRAILDVDNGASGYDVKFYTSDDGASWTQLGTTRTGVGTTSIYAGTASVGIGARTGGFVPSAGKVYRAIIKNGIDGTTVLDVDTSVITSGSAASFTATTGQTVTINRSTSGRKSVAVVSPVWLLGTDDYMEVADNDLLDFGATDSFTVLWIGREWATPTSYGRLIDKAGTFPAAGWSLQQNATNTTTYAAIADGTTTASRFGASTITAGSLGIAGFIVDRSAQTIRTFSGSSLSTTSSTSSIGSLANANAMRVGSIGSTPSGYQDFEFIAGAVFRRALTADEIARIVTYYQRRG